MSKEVLICDALRFEYIVENYYFPPERKTLFFFYLLSVANGWAAEAETAATAKAAAAAGAAATAEDAEPVRVKFYFIKYCGKLVYLFSAPPVDRVVNLSKMKRKNK